MRRRLVLSCEGRIWSPRDPSSDSNTPTSSSSMASLCRGPCEDHRGQTSSKLHPDQPPTAKVPLWASLKSVFFDEIRVAAIRFLSRAGSRCTRSQGVMGTVPCACTFTRSGFQTSLCRNVPTLTPRFSCCLLCRCFTPTPCTADLWNVVRTTHQQIYPWTEIQEAHREMEANNNA